MRELLVIGLVTLVSGLGSYRIQGEIGAFSGANIAVGIAALLGAAVARLRAQLRAGGLANAESAAPGALLDSLLGVVAVVWGVSILYVAAVESEVRFDWTFERRYELAPATCQALRALAGPPSLTLYYEAGDPRVRRTRQLLDEVARCGNGVAVRNRSLDAYPEDEDRFGIGSSNSVVLELDGRWGTVERPTEGALFEALSLLGTTQRGVIYVTNGTGEGNLQRADDLGFSGLAVALQTEGYTVRTLPTSSISEVPDDAAVVLVIAPERRLRDVGLDALRRYLERGGGSLIAMLEPCRTSGIEELLAEFGIRSADRLLIDPASGPVDGERAGVSPLAYNYGQHPTTRGLDSNRMTFFRRARTFTLRKPQVTDKLVTTVYASGQSWQSDEACGAGPHSPEPPPGARTDYHPLLVTGLYQRGEGETRIAAFGDASFASNRDLRAIYNLDLIMNTVHWAAQREPAITIRPKTGGVLQFPVPIQNSLNAFYGVGMAMPELLLLVGALVWLRRRSA